jgi:hypothetical protein
MQRRISVVGQFKVPNRPILVGDLLADNSENMPSMRVGFGPIHSHVCLLSSRFIVSFKTPLECPGGSSQEREKCRARGCHSKANPSARNLALYIYLAGRITNSRSQPSQAPPESYYRSFYRKPIRQDALVFPGS